MKTIIKLVIAALVVHATWRAAAVYWRYFQFRDGVQHIAQFSAQKSEPEVQAQVIEAARTLDVPVPPDSIKVRREQTRTLIDAVYTDRVQLIPTKYYPWEFKVNVDAIITLVPKPGE
jgi:hypothetical protein